MSEHKGPYANQHGPGSGCVYPGCDTRVYQDGTTEHTHLRGWLTDVVCFSYQAGRISEGQASRLLGVDRMTWRTMRDEWIEKPERERVKSNVTWRDARGVLQGRARANDRVPVSDLHRIADEIEHEASGDVERLKLVANILEEFLRRAEEVSVG